ncbi:MAG: hypothetical protein JXA14_26080 [Anaerolineae bacterium]|nr:hypothetical protein [Anaerolineae bacterium]
MTSASFARMATVTASTKRPPAFSNGKRGNPTAHLAGVACLPLDPLSPDEIRAITPAGRTQELLQTFCQGGLDIKEGDFLVVGSKEYPIKFVGEWTWPPDSADYLCIVVEDVKTT